MAKKKPPAAPEETKPIKPTCGLVMPISDSCNYRANHWKDVARVLIEAIEDAGFTCQLVSQADDTRIIHDTIVRNLYLADMIVADVSSKNANVMFELGMRLTFDKPVVIVKDDATDFSFDIGNIEHLPYPHDLRHQIVVDFKTALGKKVRSTFDASRKGGYKSFLKHFQILDIPTIDKKVGTKEDLIVEMLKDVQSMLSPAQAKQPKQPPVRESLTKRERERREIFDPHIRFSLEQFGSSENPWPESLERLNLEVIKEMRTRIPISVDDMDWCMDRVEKLLEMHDKEVYWHFKYPLIEEDDGK